MTWWPETAADVDKPRGNEYRYVREVLDYGWHNTRSPGFNMRLEQDFAEKFGVNYAVTHNSGSRSCEAPQGEQQPNRKSPFASNFPPCYDLEWRLQEHRRSE